MIVLDASVVLKWFQEERDSEKALAFEERHVRGEETIAAPDLLFYEIANVLRHQKGIRVDAIEAALEVLGQLEIQALSFSPFDLKEVVKFAAAQDTSVYDALYVILARRLGCRFVTADKRLYMKLRTLGWVDLL